MINIKSINNNVDVLIGSGPAQINNKHSIGQCQHCQQ